MPMRSSLRTWLRGGPLVGGLVTLLLLSLPSPYLSAQDRGAIPDSSALLEEAREVQGHFEGFRQSRIPPRTRQSAPRCDERIGRICHWFGGADEADFPPEPPETAMARRELLRTLFGAWEQVTDPWVLGQLVRYLVEDERFAEARGVARECGLPDAWWCDALDGYVLHVEGDFLAAEEAFRRALAALPESEHERWRTPRFLLSRGGEAHFRGAGAQERVELWERLWRFSNPLFLVEGNDRLTDHYARLVVARMHEGAENAYQFAWGEDLEEALIRYGRTIGWSRTQSAPAGAFDLGDTRSTVGHHHPGSRGYLFPEEFLESPADIPPEAWITAPREARTWYAAPYAPDFRGLETQVARFRRGDSLLVVGAFRPDPGSLVAGAPERIPEGDHPLAGRSDPFRRDDPFAGGAMDDLPPDEPALETGFFLLAEGGGEPFVARDAVEEGVLTLSAPTGQYVSSLEVLDREGGAAWRARQGVSQGDLPRGLVDVSDILLLREGTALPENLEEAIPLARPGIRIRPDEQFAVVWEVYGLDVEETARITLGFTRGRPGFLQRVGQFLGILEPDAPLEVQFDETTPDDVQIVFRAIYLELPQMEPGQYTLHLRLELPGREPSTVDRPIVLEP